MDSDLALANADVARRLLHRLLEAEDEQQQERRERDCDQGEVPVQPEHQAQHEDDGQRSTTISSVDDDAKFWIVATSLVMVDTSVPILAWS